MQNIERTPCTVLPHQIALCPIRLHSLSMVRPCSGQPARRILSVIFPQSVEVHNSWSGSGSQLNSIYEIMHTASPTPSLQGYTTTQHLQLPAYRVFTPSLQGYTTTHHLQLPAYRVIQPHSISNCQLTGLYNHTASQYILWCQCCSTFSCDHWLVLGVVGLME